MATNHTDGDAPTDEQIDELPSSYPMEPLGAATGIHGVDGDTCRRLRERYERVTEAAVERRPDHEPPTFELFVDNYTDTEYHVLAGVDVTDDSVLEIDVNELDELALVMSGEEINRFCGSMDELGERLADVLDEHLDVRYLFEDEP